MIQMVDFDLPKGYAVPLHIKPPTSAMLAARRLRHIVAADRRDVPCWRWVRLPDMEHVRWLQRMFEYAVMGIFYTKPPPPEGKPRYHYEGRR